MRAGRMDRLVTLFRKETEQDAAGQDQITWVPVAKVWAAWAPLRGANRWAAMQTVETAAGSFEIRYRPDLGPLHEVAMEGERYEIQGAPEEVGRREGLRLHVSRRQDYEG